MNAALTDLVALDIPFMDTTTFGDYKITVEHDDTPVDPRDWDNIGTIVCWHRNYAIGDKHDFENPHNMFHELSGLYPMMLTDGLTSEQLARCEAKARDTHIILPVYLYDHSGITINTTGFSDGWDSGQVGFVYVSHDRLRDDHNWKKITSKRAKQAAEWLVAEIETYDNFLIGNVYGFTIEKDEETIDSAYGFYGDCQYMVDEIKAFIKDDMETNPQQLELF